MSGKAPDVSRRPIPHIGVLDAARRVLGTSTRVNLRSGAEVFPAVAQLGQVMIPADNVRLRPGFKGVMRAHQEMQAALYIEAALTETHWKASGDKAKIDKGYNGMTPRELGEFVLQTAEEVGFTQPLILHVDHTTVKDEGASLEDARAQLQAYLAEGVAGSVSIDASHLQPHRNVAVTADLAREIQARQLGLEVEIGEIGNARAKTLAKESGHAPTRAEKKLLVSTVWEARGIMDPSEHEEFVARYGREPEPSEVRGFIPSLVDMEIVPHLLAIDNGSTHGNYKPGEEVSIFLGRTSEIATAIYQYGVTIAQHGITGTPLDMLYLFILAGITKGNVGTNWQNIAHANMDPALFGRMRQWVADQKAAGVKGVDIKHATKQFCEEIGAMEQRYVDAIDQAAYVSAKQFIEAFRCAGSGPRLMAVIGN